ncbi:hypothetical protein DD606_26125 [Enterobacter cloacae complex sp. GF14B]|nr:hypothetical protein DD606_26125 [Enterobacter cloacae complex sp. GF14B]
MVKTLMGTIKLFTDSPDLSCQMLKKICRTLLACIEVFTLDKSTNSTLLSTADTVKNMMYDRALQPSPKVLHLFYQRIMFMPSFHMQAFEEAFYTGFFTHESKIFGPTLTIGNLRYESHL